MNWGIFWEAMKQIIFWAFLILGLASGWGALAVDGVSWQYRGVGAIVFLVCLMILGLSLHVFN